MESKSTRIFPSVMPTALAGDFEFEIGYTLDTVEGFSDYSHLLCGLCQRLPRNPLELSECGHLFCFCCSRKVGNCASTNSCQVQCLKCGKHSWTCDILLTKHHPSTIARIFHSLRIKCKHGCGYKAGPIDLDEHEVLKCPQRPTHCPNFGCPLILPAQQLITDHFHSCQYYKVYCEDCRLPIAESDLLTHDCLERLKDALRNFYLYFNTYQKPIPPQLSLSAPGTPLFDIAKRNRSRFLEGTMHLG